MQEVHQSRVWRIFQVATGNFLESYDVVIFAYFAPSIGRAYFEEIAKAASGPGKPDPARLTEIMLRYGLIPA